MSDQLKVQIISQLTEEDTGEVRRLIDEQYLIEPTSYNSGKQYLAGSATDTKVADSVNLIIMSCDKKFTIKIDSAGATAMSNSRIFTYTGDPKSFFISNPNSDPIEVKIITATLNN